MRAVLVGAGSIGGAMAVMITEAGYDLDVVAHGEEKARLFRDEGFRLTGAFGDRCVKLKAYPSVGALDGIYDVCLIATKYQQMPEVARQMLPHLRDDSLVVSVQNGIVLDLLSDVVGKERTVGVMIGFGATLKEANLVNVTAGAELVIGMPDGYHPSSLDELAEMLSSVLPTATDDDIVSRLWSKVIFNSCINSLAGISGLTVGETLEYKKARLAFMDIIREGITVAEKQGYDVPKFNVLPRYQFLASNDSKLFRSFWGMFFKIALGAKSGNVRPSTLQSLEKGRKTEIDIMNGYISSQGKKCGVATPVNDLLTLMIKQIENGERRISPDNFAEL